jgi:hypothetical protein
MHDGEGGGGEKREEEDVRSWRVRECAASLGKLSWGKYVHDL